MRNALDIATTGCSVNVRLSEDKKTFERVRIGYGVASPIPVRAPSAEAFINGKEITDDNIKKFALTVLEDINPRDSWRAGKALRQHISVVMAERALRECITLAGGEVNG
jgi:xanthine dehydrogenase FAD-binding subunit